MFFSVVICTYNRPKSLGKLLRSIEFQTKYPDEILVIDGSTNEDTALLFSSGNLKNLKYWKVGVENRGLTQQRNFGIKQVSPGSQVIFFLDDDTYLDQNYFEQIHSTYEEYPEALGVSGYITNETEWKKVPEKYEIQKGEFLFDGWVRIEGSRFQLRRMFGLEPDVQPGKMPAFSHGYSTGFLPPSGKTYQVEMLMGGIASYRKKIFESLRFSSYFEGYGLYEDADFSLRVSQIGQLYVNTLAKVEHYHSPEGRPNSFEYGRMVLRNGWYVWRLKNPSPSFKARFKWHAISFLLTLVRLGNVLTTSNKKEALTESFGRISGWTSLLFKKPVHEHKRSDNS